MTLHRFLPPLAAAALMLSQALSAGAQTIDYRFAGTYNSLQNGSFVSLAYTGTWTITDPAVTALKPAQAADVSLPAYASLWAGSSVFYTGATALQVTFANGATLAAPTLGLVVNNTTLNGPGTPYPMGLSVQLYADAATVTGMRAAKVCADGSVDDACDDSGVDPLYRAGDAADLATQRINGAYLAFWGAPLSSSAAGVPNLAEVFGATGGGLGIYSSNELGQATTTLTSFDQLSATVTGAPLLPVPEPSTYALMLCGLAGVAWHTRRRNPPSAH